MAYGDQPALICEMVDWARAAGFEVVVRRQGHEVPAGLPPVHARHGVGPLRLQRGAGRRRRLQRADVQLLPRRHQVGARDGAPSPTPPASRRRRTDWRFPPCGVDDLPTLLRPRRRRHAARTRARWKWSRRWSATAGRCSATCAGASTSTFEAPSDYVRRCFAQYGLTTDASGRYAAMYKPYHLIGLELGISVASAALRGEPTGATPAFAATSSPPPSAI